MHSCFAEEVLAPETRLPLYATKSAALHRTSERVSRQHVRFAKQTRARLAILQPLSLASRLLRMMLVRIVHDQGFGSTFSNNLTYIYRYTTHP